MRVVLMLTLLIAISSAQAEVIYKSVGPDGSVEYSEAPPRGAVKVEPIDVETLTPEQRHAARLLRQREKAKGQAVSEQVQDYERRLAAADREVNDAQRALAEADQALQAGRAPQPGDRRGTAGGLSRLTESYFQRIATLEQGVEEARKRLNRAYDARNALR